MTKKLSPSIDQYKLKVLCDHTCDKIEELLEYFDIEYKNSGKMITMPCPIHGGDNSSAINIYPDGDTYRGNWKCRTHNCEDFFKNSILGFIRGVLSHKKYGWEKPGDRYVTFDEAIDFATSFCDTSLKDIHVSKSSKSKQAFSNMMAQFKNTDNQSSKFIRREAVTHSLEIPCEYFISRGYTKDILLKYDVGLCDKPGKEMSHRAVVPIYDNTHEFMIGCSGRSIFEQCQTCNAYHDPTKKCPDEQHRWIYSKWRHSKDFKSQNYLYNFWFAKEHIMSTTVAIIVESPGNVWRLEENGIHNSVGIFGSSMSDRQKIILDSSGAMNLVILTDNDEAGRKAAAQIKQKCQNTYKIYVPTISKGDVGEMTNEEINNEIKSILEKIV